MISYCLKLRRFLPPALAWLLLLMTSLAPGLDARAAAAPAEPAALKGQLLKIPIGSPIEVRLLSKEKIRGQLAAVADDAVSIKTVVGSAIDEKKVPFDQVRSVKQVRGGLSVGAKVAVTVVIAGIILGVLGILAAAGLGSS